MHKTNSILFKTICVLLATLLMTSSAVADCTASKIDGEEDAKAQHSSSGWFLGGVGSGILLGLIGTGVITGAAALTNPQPRDVPRGVDETCYKNGYTKKAKSKNTWTAFAGGLGGTLILAVIYLSAQND